MLLLILIGVLAGLIAGVSPCVLPVLPVIFFAGAGTAPRSVTRPDRTADRAPGRRRSLLVIAGLAVSFAVFTLLGSTLLGALGLPPGFLRWAGLIVLTLVGLGLLFPRLDGVLQRPFRRLSFRWPSFRRGAVLPTDGSLPAAAGGTTSGSAFLLGLALGTLYVPCAGPVLAAISIAGSTGQVSGGITALTVAFAVGVAIPLFVFAVAGAGIAQRLSAYRSRSRNFRIAGGLVMVLLAVALAGNLTDGLQRAVPGYTQTLQNRIEDNAAARKALTVLGDAPITSPPGQVAVAPAPTSAPAVPRAQPPAPVAAPAGGPVVTCISQARTLANCGAAPQIVGIQSWLNTPKNGPVSLAQLRGKVVLINFWTYSCINCQRALPAVKAWYGAYRASGLEVIGVHTPEFAFEHDLGNVRDAVSSDGVRYPVALDNGSSTWQNYHNSYWPAEYLIDADGVVRHVAYGEGGYADSERLIRELLRSANPSIALPAPVDPAVPVG